MKTTILIRRLIWTYMVLLLFEGALRKWIVPGLSSLLLIVRDPIVIAIYILAAKRFPWRSPLVPACVVLALLGLPGSLLANRYDPVVAAYGIRVDFLHLPLIFVIPCYMYREHVVHMGKWLMILAIPIMWLMMMQFDATMSSSWNVGAGGKIGGQLMAAVGDKARASGPFSFITGPVLFFPLVAAFVFNALSYQRQSGRLVTILAGAACVLAVPVAVSRSLMFGMIITTCCYLLATMIQPRLARVGVKALIVVALLFSIIGATRIFQESSTYLGKRMDSATSQSGSFQAAVIDRFFGDLAVPFQYFTDIPVLGYGLGVGTNVGSFYLTGANSFLLPEGEWGRIVFESGPFLGFAFIALRLAIVFLGFQRSLRCLRRGDALPILIWSAVALNIMNGQWGPPTTLGFAALGGGLMFAACRRAPEEKRLESDEEGNIELPGPAHAGGTDTRLPIVTISRTTFADS